MLFLYRGYERNYVFRLFTEWIDAEKFDDLVVEYIKDNKKVYCFLQAKHRQGEPIKISLKDLKKKKRWSI